MESKKEIRIKLSTAVVMVIITIFLIVLGFICYVKITKNNNKYVQETYSSNSLQEGEKYNSIENKSEEENIIEQGKMENKKITQSEAKEILSTQYNKLAKLHTENQFKYSSSEMEKNFKAKITNYNSIINNIFTENGKEIYEKEMNEFITIENGDAYIHAGDDNSGEVYAGFDIENIKIESESSIKCTIIKKIDYSMMSDEKTEIVKVRSDFIVKKVNGKWLIDEFEWMEDDNYEADTNSQHIKYSEITKKLQNNNILSVTDAIDNNDGTYTLKGKIITVDTSKKQTTEYPFYKETGEYKKITVSSNTKCIYSLDSNIEKTDTVKNVFSKKLYYGGCFNFSFKGGKCTSVYEVVTGH